MGRNLVVCCDGTNNQFGSENTNIVRLVQTLERDPRRQLVYYDPGVGTLPEPGFVSGVGQLFSEVAGLAFGAGLVRKVGQAYAFLMQHWEPGDRVFLFGFSRGAYSVRALAALLHMYGLMPAGSENLLPYLLRMFKASRRKLGKSGSDSFWQLTHEFRETFGQPLFVRGARGFPIHFMGVWDTVSSVGWAWDPQRFPFTRSNPSIATIRHAVSLDERRAFFRQHLFKRVDPFSQDLVEVWFPGVHADVGGGYSESEGGLWREPYRWMLEEAKRCGLLTDPQRENQVWNRSPVPERPWSEPAHESLTWKWRAAELFPKLPYRGANRWRWPRLNFGRPRIIPEGALMHWSVMRRKEQLDPPYKPRALREVEWSKLATWQAPQHVAYAPADSFADQTGASSPSAYSADYGYPPGYPPAPAAESGRMGSGGEVREGDWNWDRRGAGHVDSDAGGGTGGPERYVGGDSGGPEGEASGGVDYETLQLSMDEMPPGAAAEVDMEAAVEGLTLEPPEPRFLQALIRERAEPSPRATMPLKPSGEYLAAVRVGIQSDEYADTGTPAPIPPFEDNVPHDFDIYFLDLHKETIAKATISLPPSGSSTECEFAFVAPNDSSAFRARIVLCHDGRILQGALLQVPVGALSTAKKETLAVDVAAPILGSDEMHGRRFDLALTLDQGRGDDLTGFVAGYGDSVAANRAKVIRVGQQTLNMVSNGIAQAFRTHVNSEHGRIDLDSPGLQTLLRVLALHGSTLYQEVIEPSKLCDPGGRGRRLSIACSAESYFPAEFIYDRAAPAAGAPLCSSFGASLSTGVCCGEYRTRGEEVVCPLGFWGLSCVIERKCGAVHGSAPVSPEQFQLMYRAATSTYGLPFRNPALLAFSDAVDKVDPGVSSALKAELKNAHHVDSDSVSNWGGWQAAIERLEPAALVLLPHHATDEYQLEYLQIGSETTSGFESHPNYLNSRRVNKRHVLASDEASAPLVLLVGCETARARIPFENFVIAFERAGAASVVGTTAPVIGRHAGPAVALLMNELSSNTDPQRLLGELVLEAKRKILLAGYPMIMCLATYGGADHAVWGVAKTERNP